MYFFHDSRSEQYRSPSGAAPCAGKVRLRVLANGFSSVTLRIWWQNAEYRWYMRRMENDIYEYELQMPEEPGIVWYFFIGTDDQGQTWYLGNAWDGLGGEGNVTRHDTISCV